MPAVLSSDGLTAATILLMDFFFFYPKRVLVSQPGIEFALSVQGSNSTLVPARSTANTQSCEAVNYR